MPAPAKRSKIAVLTTLEAGKPDLRPIEGAAEVAYSCDVGIEKALENASAALLWNIGLVYDLQDHWEWMDGVRWMHVAAADVDELRFPALVDSPLVLTNAGGVYDLAIAEYVTGAVIAYERNYARIYKQMQHHAWRPFISSGLSGKNALVIGSGRIGRACARSLRTLGMNVRGIGDHLSENDPDFERIDSFEQLDGCIGWAHHVVITAPLTPETHHMINGSVLKYCRSNVHIVNVGRGPVVYTPDLIYALQQGWVGGATLDVFEEEPLSDLSPLWSMANVLVTPHVAGEIEGIESALVRQFVRNAQHFLRGEKLESVVDKQRGYAPASA